MIEILRELSEISNRVYSLKRRIASEIGDDKWQDVAKFDKMTAIMMYRRLHKTDLRTTRSIIEEFVRGDSPLD